MFREKRRYLVEVLERRRLLSTWCVDSNSPGPTHDGTSWSAAFTDLQQALTAATSGDQIHVAQGTYRPTTTTTRTIYFQLKSGVAITGGYAGSTSATPDARNFSLYPTILSGDIGALGNAADNSYHVVYASSVTSTGVLDGFTIRDGNANLSSDPSFGGGGMQIRFGSPVVRNCTFIDNAAFQGGAIYANNSSSAISYCMFLANAASLNGGGLYSDTNCLLNLSNCSWVGNAAGSNGGAIYKGASTSLTVSNSTATANSAALGGGIYTTSGSTSLSNCIFWGNTASVAGSQQWWTLFSPNFTYSDVQASSDINNGNISGDPLFVRSASAGADNRWGTADDDYGDLRISAASPCVDAGNNAAVVAGTTTDLAGSPRFQDVPTSAHSGAGTRPLVDMGAYEAAPALAASAGGPYVVLQGHGLTLRARGASNLSGTLQYAWEWTGDGLFNDGSGANVSFPVGSFAVGSTASVSVRVTDSGAHSITSSSSVRVVPTTAYVDFRATGGNDTGVDWSNAYTGLVEALKYSLSGQTIRIATGTYKPTTTTDRTATFQCTSGASLLGGYAGGALLGAPDTRDLNLYPTTLSGDIGTIGNSADNCFHVIIAAGTIDGFTITGGNANGSDANSFGGGIYVGTGAIRSCTIVSNLATSGGALYIDSGTSASFTDCTFASNAASSNGGAAYNNGGVTFTNCTFSGNTASTGGGFYEVAPTGPLSATRFTNCAFTTNAAASGGGIAIGNISGTNAPVLTNCSFTRNTASSYGGGVYTFSATPTFTNCALNGNSASSRGGAMYISSATPTMNNCTIVGNSAVLYGGGLFISSSSSTFLYNCTLSSNTAFVGGGIYSTSSSPTIDNSILWSNIAGLDDEFHLDATGSPTFFYTDIQGGHAGTGNISADPLFLRDGSSGSDGVWGTADDDYGDMRPFASSPTVDAGANSAVPSSLTTDFAGNPRFTDIATTTNTGSGTAPIVDMGAYEAVPGLAASTGGPYVVVQGHALTLNGQGASNVAGALTYAWEWTGDGLFDDAAGASPVFPVSSFAAGSTITIAVRVTDSGSNSTVSTSTVHIVRPTIYVDPRATGGANSGTDWNNAYTSLASALLAAIPAQSIHVAGGTYLPSASGDRAAYFNLKQGVALLGGYAGLLDPTNPDVRDFTQHPSILSGDIGAAGVSSDNSYHVLIGFDIDATAALDGFTITGGNANGSAVNAATPGTNGGGLYLSYASPVISNCSFINNSASDFAGAVGMVNCGSAFSKCTFSGNNSYRGGAVYADISSATWSDCTFSNNAGSVGGGLHNSNSSGSITRCTFIGNTAAYGGGGIINYNNSSPTISNCVFTANAVTTTGLSGGGGAIDNSYSYAIVTNCIFNGNSSASYGGALCNDGYTPLFANCTFVGNSAISGGGAALNEYTGTATFRDCTFSSNSSAGVGGALYNYYQQSASVINCIAWSNTAPTGPEVYNFQSATAPIANSDIQGGYAGTGNLNADPQFVRTPSAGADGKWGTGDDDYGDLRLQATSPCINAGDNTAIPAGITSDLGGHLRIINGIVDMGAYERGLTPTISGSSGPDSVYVRLSADQTLVQIWNGSTPSGSPSATYAVNSLENATFDTGAGDDSVSVDLANGAIPQLSILAGDGNNTLVLLGGSTATDLNVQPGTVTFGSTPITRNAVEQVRLDASPGGAVNVGAMIIGAATAVAAGKNLTLVAASLSISATAALDLNDNDLVVNNGGFTSLAALVMQGYGGTTGITSSTSNGGNTILALFDNALIGVSEWPQGSGHKISSSAIVGKYTYFGDMDLDWQVTAGDYGVLDANLGSTPASGIAWLSGDADLDGTVTSGDYGILDANLGSGAGTPLTPAASIVAAPSSVRSIEPSAARADMQQVLEISGNEG